MEENAKVSAEDGIPGAKEGWIESKRAISLGKLVRIVMGDDSLDDFSTKTTLSKSYLSRMMNGKNPNIPRRSSLKKIAEVNPSNRVHLNDLLLTAGYAPEPCEAQGKDFSELIDNVVVQQPKRLSMPELLRATIVVELDLIENEIKNYCVNYQEQCSTIKFFHDSKESTLTVLSFFYADSDSFDMTSIFNKIQMVCKNETSKETSSIYCVTDSKKIYTLLNAIIDMNSIRMKAFLVGENLCLIERTNQMNK